MASGPGGAELLAGVGALIRRSLVLTDNPRAVRLTDRATGVVAARAEPGSETDAG
jgi:hypothetical protein